jgi:hypothetical protein
MSNGSGGNPLFFHGIVLFVVAALLLTLGVIGLVGQLKAQGVEGPGSLNDVVRAQSDLKGDMAKSTQLTRGPSSLTEVNQKLQMGKEMGEKAKKLLPYITSIAMLVVALGTAAAGLFVIWQANWARYVGFAVVFLTLLYYTWLQSVENGNPELEFQVWRPLVLVVLAALGGKFLFDMWVEKFEAA